MDELTVIAITGLPGAGSSTIAKLLAERLNLKYFSPGEYFKNHSDRKKQIEQALDVFQSGLGKEKYFHEKIDEIQRKLGKEGNVVICGKLSIFILKDIADFKIWLDCSFEERVRRTAERDGLKLRDVEKMLKEREKLEVDEWKKDYGIDYRKQRDMADLIIDNTRLSKEETVEKILDFIQKHKNR
ncbi:MAG: cytidylate kinase family protein [Candidatus Aenigmatarchaeota archaeon]